MACMLAIFDLQITLILSTKFPWQPSWISHWILIYKLAWYCFQSIGLFVQETKGKTDFQDGGHGGHLGFPIRTILATFVSQVTPILHTKFRVSWPKGVGGVVFRSKLLTPHNGWLTMHEGHWSSRHSVAFDLGLHSLPFTLIWPYRSLQTMV